VSMFSILIGTKRDDIFFNGSIGEASCYKLQAFDL
jgi:hypothetical protein